MITKLTKKEYETLVEMVYVTFDAIRREKKVDLEESARRLVWQMGLTLDIGLEK